MDLHIVLVSVDGSAFGSLLAAAEETVQGLAAEAGRPWRIELRHGPFKPAPGPARDLQLHLVLDDEGSLAQSPCALIAQRAATGLLLLGEPLPGKRADCESATWLREARVELTRWRDALGTGEIPFRHWVFDPEPRLVEGRTAAKTAWELRCLMLGAARASDLHYRAVVLTVPEVPVVEEDLVRPLLSQLGEDHPWQALPGCWGRVKDRAIAIIERRLDHISAIKR